MSRNCHLYLEMSVPIWHMSQVKDSVSTRILNMCKLFICTLKIKKNIENFSFKPSGLYCGLHFENYWFNRNPELSRQTWDQLYTLTSWVTWSTSWDFLGSSFFLIKWYHTCEVDLSGECVQPPASYPAAPCPARTRGSHVWVLGLFLPGLTWVNRSGPGTHQANQAPLLGIQNWSTALGNCVFGGGASQNWGFSMSGLRSHSLAMCTERQE